MNIPDEPMAMSHQIHTYTELRQQIHHDLRIQHPEWILSNGESPMCDSYEARLMELLDAFARKGSNEAVAGMATGYDTCAPRLVKTRAQRLSRNPIRN
jgi:hypothetical protein